MVIGLAVLVAMLVGQDHCVAVQSRLNRVDVYTSQAACSSYTPRVAGGYVILALGAVSILAGALVGTVVSRRAD